MSDNKNDKFDAAKATEEARRKFLDSVPMFNIRLGSGSFGDRATLIVEVTGGSYEKLFGLAEQIGILVAEHTKSNLENNNLDH